MSYILRLLHEMRLYRLRKPSCGLENAATSNSTIMMMIRNPRSLPSPLITQYLITFTTAALSSFGFIASLMAAMSCDFLRVNLTQDTVGSWSDSSDGSLLDDWNVTNSWYLNEASAKTRDQTLSLGIICTSDSLYTIIDGNKNSTMRSLSISFIVFALLLGAALTFMTYGISTVVYNTDRLWSSITVISGLTFLSELPVFCIVGGPPCNNSDFICSLANGSFSLFCSMVCYLILAVFTLWKDAPDWKEEYDLWRLIKQNHIDRVKRIVQDNEDEELGMGTSFSHRSLRNVEHINEIPDPLTVTCSNVITSERNVVAFTDNESHAVNMLRKNCPTKMCRMIETSDIVGKCINVTRDSSISSRGTSENYAISPITQVSEDAGLATLIETQDNATTCEAPQEFVQLAHDVLLNENSIYPYYQQKRGKGIKISDVNLSVTPPYRNSPIPEMFSDFDDNTKVSTTKQNISQLERGCEDDSFWVIVPCSSNNKDNNETDILAQKTLTIKQSRNLTGRSASKSVHNSLANSFRFPSEQLRKGMLPASTKSPSSNERISSIFRKKTTENGAINHSLDESREEIQDSLLIEQTSLGMSNSDEPFKPEGNRGHCGSLNSLKSRQAPTVLSWKSRCRSPKPLRKMLREIHRDIPQAALSWSSRCSNMEPLEFQDPSNSILSSQQVTSCKQSAPQVMCETWVEDSQCSNSFSSIYRDIHMSAATKSQKTRDLLTQDELSSNDASSHFRRTSHSVCSKGIKKNSRDRCGNPNLPSGSSVKIVQTIDKISTLDKSNREDCSNRLEPPQNPNLTKSNMVSPCANDILSHGEMYQFPRSSFISLGKFSVQRSLTGSAIVSPDKDDPGMEMYPSDSSLSTLSLPTGSDHFNTSESEDDHTNFSLKSGTIQYSADTTYGKNTDLSSTELSEIIAGVQRTNRKTSGKITPINKRRRRRKRSSKSGGLSSGTEYSSNSGSLLDEVIAEEGELYESEEAKVPYIIDASPMKKIKSPKKKNSLKKKSKSSLNSHNAYSHFADDEFDSGYKYGSDYFDSSTFCNGHSYSDSDSNKSEYRHFKKWNVQTTYRSEESLSSRAAMARRKRIVSKKRVHVEPETISKIQNVSPFLSDTSGSRSSSQSYYSTQGSKSGINVPIQTRSSQFEFSKEDMGSLLVNVNSNWQARKSRISRLRNQREQAAFVDTTNVECSVLISCTSDEASI